MAWLSSGRTKATRQPDVRLKAGRYRSLYFSRNLFPVLTKLKQE
jgi:hypothetical protein